MIIFKIPWIGFERYQFKEKEMIEIKLTADDLEVIIQERYNHPSPKVQRRMEVLWLKSKGFQHNEIATLAGVCDNTVTNCLRMYNDGGLDEIRKIDFYRPKSELENHRQSIEDFFREHPFATISEAIAKIEELTGIERKPTQVRKFLKNLGMRPRKVGSIPSKADTIAQQEFMENQMSPVLEEAKAGKRHVLFMDAAHFVFAPFLGILWCFTRLFVKAPSGRQRFNVLGAIHAISHEMTMVTNTGYINSLSVIELLKEIANKYAGLPITIVLDNAKYQRCYIVQEMALSLNIDLLFLPAYSPNLNLIERVWKFVKKKCLYSKYYPDFDAFKQAISGCLKNAHGVYKSELDSLLSLRFQTFKESQLVAA